jgi:hypothetical protein
MMDYPAERNFKKSQIVLLCNGTNDFDSIKVTVLEIASLVHFPLPIISALHEVELPSVGCESARFHFFIGTIFPGEESS